MNVKTLSVALSTNKQIVDEYEDIFIKHTERFDRSTH